MTKPTYTALTIGALLKREFDVLLPVLKKEDNTQDLINEAKENNILGIKTESARERVLYDIRRRLKVIPEKYWDFYDSASDVQRKIMLFYLILQSYPVALDLHLEVVLPKWKKMERTLDKFDLQMRLDELSTTNEQVEKWAEKTKANVIKNYMKSLKEAYFLKENELTKLPDQPASFWQYFIEIGESWFLEACLLSKTERDKLL